jgi:endonuclease I
MTVNRKTREFIPTQESRGKIARALGYFVIKYDYLSVLDEVIDVKHSWNGT